MTVTRRWGAHHVIMDTCALCGVGAGASVFPDGTVHVFAEHKLVEDLCADCRRWRARHPRQAARIMRRLDAWRGRRPVVTPSPEPVLA